MASAHCPFRCSQLMLRGCSVLMSGHAWCVLQTLNESFTPQLCPRSEILALARPRSNKVQQASGHEAGRSYLSNLTVSAVVIGEAALVKVSINFHCENVKAEKLTKNAYTNARKNAPCGAHLLSKEYLGELEKKRSNKEAMRIQRQKQLSVFWELLLITN
ncbi:uncharacterized protein LOC34623472 [Cyclospora cayetanensis]|uniref:Uncharacterized protein LOC34623472 n=1 Tax=Cyclospora cayetanensis TaxID=88456 RepID=A0A6P6RRG9_9EIME|nr:uncharacterized protein LOC34623472 [Cyclospora cayetanensis]